MKLPRITPPRREPSLDEYREQIAAARDRLGAAAAAHEQADAAVADLPNLDADVALGLVEPEVAEAARAEAQEALRAAQTTHEREQAMLAALERGAAGRAREEAQRAAWRSDAASQLRRGVTSAASSRQTLHEAAAAFLDGIDRGSILSRGGEPYKPSVRRAYRRDLEQHVLPDLGALRLSELRRADVQALVDRLVAAGTSPTRIQGIVMPLRAVCRRAIERDEVAVNPTSNVRLPAVMGQRDRVAAPAEAEELLAALPEADRPVWATALYAGLRRGELRGLRWSDVDLAGNRIAVVRSWDDVEGPVAPKSRKGERRVPIPGVLRRVLIEHKMRTGRDGGDLVFGSSASRPFTPSNLRRRARVAWEEENARRAVEGRPSLRGIGLHECRHTYVSLMHEAGLSLERIGDYVGHASTYMTDRYRHLLEGHEADAAARLDAFLGAAGARTGAQAV